MTDPTNHGIRVVHQFIGGASSLGDALTELSELAVASAAADMAGLTVNDERANPTTVVYTDDVVTEIDQAQYDADRGPCLDAYRGRHIVHLPDVRHDDRYPEFAESAQAHDMHTSLSIPLVVGGRGLGALNIYAAQPGTFDETAVESCTYLGRQAAIIAAYYDKAEQADHLQRALLSRAVIDQAKGIIMASTGCDAQTAFDLLRQQSQGENRKLREIAEDLVAAQPRTRR